MAAKLLEVWRGDTGSRCAAAMRGRAGARGPRARTGRQAGWPRGLRAAKMEDGGAEPRKHSSPPLPHPPFPARRGGEGGGERSASERARGRRKRPPCPPRPPSSSPEPAAGRPGPALGELKWRTAFSSSSSSPLLPSRAGAAGKMEDSGIVPCSAAAPPACPARARKLSLPVRSPSHTLACPVSRGA
ncbi:collagen alpha-1(III) chain-like [Pyrgilauda ruficollis]|uniref:collagen alpha-1(III) chain-like n=1 Tax=Pyrgilauda ruficollis TaxID=221976 RepID=UPI001B87CE42|nr:collagen alpha-1(III) chain-like [Pyrgilauda ruficollis]